MSSDEISNGFPASPAAIAGVILKLECTRQKL
jgi:hypothetical protein